MVGGASTLLLSRPRGGKRSRPNSAVVKKVRKMMATTKAGVTTPMYEMTRTRLSIQESLWRALSVPRVMPPMADITPASSTSSMEAGRKSTMSSTTGRRVRSESPRSPCRALVNQIWYC